MYKPVKHDRLYEAVVEQFEKAIVTGQVKPGDRLPTETALAEQFGVSRSAIREAMKILASKGLVEISPGKGTFCTGHLSKAFSDSLSLYIQMEPKSYWDLHVIRNILEIANAEMAARNHGGDFGSAMAESVANMDNALRDFDANPVENQLLYIQGDLDFHNYLAKATRNPFAVMLIETIGDLLRRSRQLIFSVPGSPQKAQHFHHLILEHVRHGRPNDAKAAMEKHLKQVEQDIKMAVSIEESGISL